ncbi:MAG: hypothetical protein U1A78_01755 [Polyangia bacterium]
MSHPMEPLPILLLGCIAGLSLSMRGLWRRRRARDRDEPRLPEPSELTELGRGDVIQYDAHYDGQAEARPEARRGGPGGHEQLVSVALRLSGAGPFRTLCLLEGGPAPGLLLVAERGTEGDPAWLLSALPERRKELALPGGAATESLEHAGLRYRLIGNYQVLARAVTERQPRERPGPPATSSEPLVLLMYRGPGALRLLVTRWQGEPGALLYAGEAVEPRQLTVLRTSPGRPDPISGR